MSARVITGITIGALILIAFVLFAITSSWILEWLWLSQLGYEEIFVTRRTTQVLMFLAGFLVAFIYSAWNFRFMAGQFIYADIGSSPMQQMNIQLNNKLVITRLKQFFTLGAVILGLLFGSAYLVNWDLALRYVGGDAMGEVDPLFGYDATFYMFNLPFWELIQTSLAFLAFLNFMIPIVGYLYTGVLQYSWNQGLMVRAPAYRQIALNGFIWLLLVAWGYYLDRFHLVFEGEGIVYGAGFTDVNVVLPAIWVMFIVTLLLAFFVLLSQWKRFDKAIISGAIIFFAVLILGRGILPGLIQQFEVDPNELERERAYIENNIDMTRSAYNLDEVEEIEYSAEDTITLQNIRENQDIIDNVRLWDPRLLIRTYRQLQEIRPYYSFNTVDIDRYQLGDHREQVMLSARELADQLPAESDTWVNRHMQFTHGLGMAMSPVTRSNDQGEPLMYVRDIPPRNDHEELTVDNPAIYYGQTSPHYYIVNTESEELHYPRSGENVYKHYDGEGGIPISNSFRKFLLAWEMGDINILLSDEIHQESRFQKWRGVQDRIDRVAPFLELDEDPYLVLNDGQMYWIQDAYTTSSHFPYSRPTIGGDNYIRNSVKIIVDAYDGSVDFYKVEEDDPILQLYDNMFPDLFKSMDEVPDGFEEHFRYPQNLFEAQLELYNRYHMTNPRVFYNNEDRWEIPEESYAGRRQKMDPYYLMTKLPGKDHLEYMIMSPVTPEGRNNMISWMSASADPENYGTLTSFQLPRERLIFGPAQIESRIEQDPEISRQIALWDQRGSNVIRGNLLVIPIGNSFMYVEPLFLMADQDDIPQLQRVIVAVGEEISMEPTLEAALADLFEADMGFLGPDPVAPEMPMPDQEMMEDPIMPEEAPVQPEEVEKFDEVRETWEKMREAMQNRNWVLFGEALEELDELMDE